MTDDVDRKLQIKIAQLNADLQFCLASCFGLFAGAIALIVLGYLLPSDQTSLKVLIFIVALILLSIAGYYLSKLNQCLKAFKNLQ